MPTITQDNFYSGKTKMPVGVHTACTLGEMDMETTKNGRMLLKIFFNNEKGQYIDKAIWIPDSDNPKLKDGEGKEQAIKREEKNFINECADLLGVFFDQEALIGLGGATNEAFGKAVLTKLSKAKGKCNLIVQYDQSGQYSELPKYGYIEKYEEGMVPFNPSPKHRMTPPNSGYAVPNSGDVPGPSTQPEPSDDLPF